MSEYNGIKNDLSEVDAVLGSLFGYAMRLMRERGESETDLEKWRDGLQMAYTGVNIVRGLRLAGQGMDLVGSAATIGTNAMFAIGNAANVTANILNVVDLGVNKGAAADYLWARGSEIGLHLAMGALNAIFPAYGAAFLTASMFSPTAVYNATKYAEAASDARDKFAQTNWLGDWAIANMYDDYKEMAIGSSIPIFNMLSALFPAMFSSGTSSANHILSSYGITSGSSAEDIARAKAQFWGDGFDSREKGLRDGYVAAMRKIADTTEAKRVIAITGQELRSDQATIAGFTGLIPDNSNRNYMYVLEGGKNDRLVLTSDKIDVTSNAQSQYVAFLSPVMPISGEERQTLIDGKQTTHGLKRPTKVDVMHLIDGNSDTTFDPRNIATLGSLTKVQKNGKPVNVVGTEGGIDIDGGGGDDTVVAAPRAFRFDGGEGVDGVDYGQPIQQSAWIVASAA
ncbi:hypothetical protein [Aureimonas fodinaquatilis]|nr:hypothetical protein [Aureimonas fodinaquatilis]